MTSFTKSMSNEDFDTSCMEILQLSDVINYPRDEKIRVIFDDLDFSESGLVSARDFLESLYRINPRAATSRYRHRETSLPHPLSFSACGSEAAQSPSRSSAHGDAPQRRQSSCRRSPTSSVPPLSPTGSVGPANGLAAETTRSTSPVRVLSAEPSQTSVCGSRASPVPIVTGPPEDGLLSEPPTPEENYPAPKPHVLQETLHTDQYCSEIQEESPGVSLPAALSGRWPRWRNCISRDGVAVCGLGDEMEFPKLYDLQVRVLNDARLEIDFAMCSEVAAEVFTELSDENIDAGISEITSEWCDVYDLTNIYLGDRGLQPFLSAIVNDLRFSRLILRKNGLRRNAMQDLCEILSGHPSIRLIDIRDNPFGDAGMAAAIDLAQSCPRLISCPVKNCLALRGYSCTDLPQHFTNTNELDSILDQNLANTAEVMGLDLTKQYLRERLNDVKALYFLSRFSTGVPCSHDLATAIASTLVPSWDLRPAEASWLTAEKIECVLRGDYMEADEDIEWWQVSSHLLPTPTPLDHLRDKLKSILPSLKQLFYRGASADGKRSVHRWASELQETLSEIGSEVAQHVPSLLRVENFNEHAGDPVVEVQSSSSATEQSAHSSRLMSWSDFFAIVLDIPF
eukprot:Rmarinus@m.20484